MGDRDDWQLQHYADVGAEYGRKHFTAADSAFASWIVGRIASVQPTASRVAEIGAGTCVFASQLADRLRLDEPVVCYEPVQALLDGASDHSNVQPVCGDGVAFGSRSFEPGFDLIYTKDTAHHFPADTIDRTHQGFCDNLATGGRYLMVVRRPPSEAVPVGRIARERWPELYTGLDQLLGSMRSVDGWDEIEVTGWELHVETPVAEWLDGVRSQDTWSVFSALDDIEIERTITELSERFGDAEVFDFPHEYDVGVFQAR